MHHWLMDNNSVIFVFFSIIVEFETKRKPKLKIRIRMKK